MTQAPPSSRRGITIAITLGLATVVVVAVIAGLGASSRQADAPPQPEVTNVYITCVPNDSTVTRADNGALLGLTPMTMTFPLGSGQLTVVVHHDGYQDRRVDVPLFSATGRIDVELKPLAADAASEGRSR